MSAQRQTKREQQREATRTRLVEAAERVFLEHGYAGASLSAIAREAGVTKSLIHHHFEGKQRLWEATLLEVFRRFFAWHMETLTKQGPADDTELLRQSIDGYFQFLGSAENVVRLINWIFIERDGRISAGLEPILAPSRRRIAQAQQEGTLRSDVPPIIVQLALIGLVQHWFLSRDSYRDLVSAHLPAGTDADEAYLRAIIEIFTAGMRPGGGDNEGGERIRSDHR